MPSTTPAVAPSRRLPTLAERFQGGGNSIGLLRHVLAGAVLVSHSWPLGFGALNLGLAATQRQTDVGTMSVYGFFVISGFLITGSGLRFPLGRFAWHRFLRIFPGLWACLIVTVLVIAPIAAWHENGGLAAYWDHPQGPWQYVTNNWFAGMRQWTISGLLTQTPFGNGRPAAFDGSLWSLKYELLCYVLVGLLAVTAVLRRARVVVPVLTAVTFGLVVWGVKAGSGWTAHPKLPGSLGPLSVMGSFSYSQLAVLGFLFLLGATIRLYRERVPMHGAIAAVAALALLVSLRFGLFFVVGLPAYAYLLFYLAVALPARFHAVGRDRDYSYGIYIYAFPVQQVVALLGGARWGMAGYMVISTVFTMVFSVLSWHLVEKQAMRLKDVPFPALGRRGRHAAPRVPAPRVPVPARSELVEPVPVQESLAAEIPARST